MQKTIRIANAIVQPPVRSALPSYALAVALLVHGGLVCPALADEPAVNTGLMQLAQGIVSPTGLPGPVIAPPSLPPGQNPYALADSLKIRGWIVPLPGAAGTIDQGLFGVRNKLAENGISYLGFSATTFQDNLLRHALPAGNAFGKHSRDNQLYNGQLPTYLTQNSSMRYTICSATGSPMASSSSTCRTSRQTGILADLMACTLQQEATIRRF